METTGPRSAGADDLSCRSRVFTKNHQLLLGEALPFPWEVTSLCWKRPRRVYERSSTLETAGPYPADADDSVRNYRSAEAIDLALIRQDERRRSSGKQYGQLSPLPGVRHAPTRNSDEGHSRSFDHDHLQNFSRRGGMRPTPDNPPNAIRTVPKCEQTFQIFANRTRSFQDPRSGCCQAEKLEMTPSIVKQLQIHRQLGHWTDFIWFFFFMHCTLWEQELITLMRSATMHYGRFPVPLRPE